MWYATNALYVMNYHGHLFAIEKSVNGFDVVYLNRDIILHYETLESILVLGGDRLLTEVTRELSKENAPDKTRGLDHHVIVGQPVNIGVDVLS